MKKRLREGFIIEIRKHAEFLQSFNIRLSPSFFMEDIDVEEQKHIMIRIIEPLFKKASNVLLYNDGENDYYGSSVTDAIIKKGKLFELSLDDHLFNDDFLAFWSSKDKKRGSVLVETELTNIDFHSLFIKTFDPFVVENMGAIFPKSAIRRAKSVTKDNPDAIFIGLAGCDGMTSLAIFMAPEKIGCYVQMAVEICTLSESYLLRYGA